MTFLLKWLPLQTIWTQFFKFMQSTLFVYGSLLSDFAPFKSITGILHRRAQRLGEISLPGKLYDLGNYPALVIDRESTTRVRGELLVIEQDDSFFKDLDQYEGKEYSRVQLSSLFEGQRISFQVYIYQASVAHLPQIDYEDYRDYVKTNLTHQAFIGITSI